MVRKIARWVSRAFLRFYSLAKKPLGKIRQRRRCALRFALWLLLQVLFNVKRTWRGIEGIASLVIERVHTSSLGRMQCHPPRLDKTVSQCNEPEAD